MADEKLFHLWYSRKQKDARLVSNEWRRMRVNIEFDSCYYQREDGSIVEITCVSKTEEHGCLWDDMEYLGKGKWHHVR
jgi:hypothetical protein